MAKRTRPRELLPRLLDGDRREFALAVAHQRGLVKPDRAGLVPVSRFHGVPSPWVAVVRFHDPEDPSVLAGVVAVQMISPSGGRSPEPWLVRGVLRESKVGPPTMRRVSVEHLEDVERSVGSMVLHSVSLGKIEQHARIYLRRQLLLAGAVLSLKATRRLGFEPGREDWARRVSAEAAHVQLGRGRKGYPPAHYRRIALRCIDIFQAGHRDVLKVLEKEEHRPYQTLRDWVRRARKLEFLAPTTRGRPDFRPGPNLYQDDGQAHTREGRQ